MKVIQLIKLTVKNFKGIDHAVYEFNGNNARIFGQNETKKTTVCDAVNWLITDKNSEDMTDSGKGSFRVRPHDRFGRDIHDTVISVEAEFSFDGEINILKKEQLEKKTKGVITGNVNQYYINGVLKNKKGIDSFSEFINQHACSEEVFKTLTNIFYFCGELHHKERRKILAQFAEGKKPTGYEALFARAGKLSLDEYRKTLLLARDGNESRKIVGYKTEQKEIPIQRRTVLERLKHPLDIDVEELTKQRDEKKAEITKLKLKRKEITDKEQERQQINEKINNLEAAKAKRESELENDMSGVQNLLNEKQEILNKINTLQEEANNAVDAVNEKTRKIEEAREYLATYQRNLDTARNDLLLAKEAKVVSVCHECGQKLQEDKIEANEKSRSDKIDKLTAKCNELQKDYVDKQKQLIDSLTAELLQLENAMKLAKAAVQEATNNKVNRFAEIDELIENRQTIPPETDEQWQAICNQIEETKKTLGEPVSEQLQAVDSKKESLEQEIEKLNETLAQSDRFNEDKEYVKKLEDREKELAQLICDINNELDLISQYNKDYSDIIEESVNDKFEHTKWKLFDIQVNGDLNQDVCEAVNNGSQWHGNMSTGQKIMVGIDVINTLSDYYGVSIPLFIDHAESYTKENFANTQTIELVAVKGMTEQKVEVLEESKAVA